MRMEILREIQAKRRAQQFGWLYFAYKGWLTLLLDLVVAGRAILLLTLATQLHDLSGPGVHWRGALQLGEPCPDHDKYRHHFRPYGSCHGAVARIKKFREETPSERLLAGDDMPPDD